MAWSGYTTVVGVVLAVCLGMGEKAAAQVYAFKNYGVEDGFSAAYALAFGANGSLLVGTNDGVLRFDGHSFEPVPLPGGYQGRVVRMTPGPDGSVWVLADPNRLFRLAPSGDAEALPALPVPRSDFIPIDYEINLRMDAAGRLWLNDRASRLWRYDPGHRSWRSVDLPSIEQIVDFFFQGPDTLWLATPGRVGRTTLDANRSGAIEWLFDVPNVLFMRPHPHYQALIGSRYEGIYLLNNDGTARHFFGDETWYAEPDVDADGNLLVSANGGVHRISAEGRPGLSFSSSNGLPAMPAQLLFGPEGDLWIAHSSGLSYLEHEHQVSYSVTAPDGNTESIKHLMRDPHNGALWVSTWGGMYRLHEDRIERMSTPDRRATGHAVPTRDGAIWWGEHFGLGFAFRNGRLVANTLQSEHVLFEAADGTRYLTTPGGFYRRTRTGATRISPHRLGGRFAEAGDGRIWIGGYVDETSYRPGLYTIENDSLSGECRTCLPPSIRAITEVFQDVYTGDLRTDAYGRVWVVGYQDGLFCLFRETDGTWAYRRFGAADGLLSDEVLSIYPSASGHLWIGTVRGVQGSILAPGPPDLNLAIEFRARDGLEGEQVNAVLEDERGYLWLASVRGKLHRLDWRQWPRLDSPPAYITRLGQDGQPVHPGTNPLRLRAGESRLTFHLGARTFRQPQRVHLQYRLLPVDTAWTDLGADLSVQVPFLPAGRHTFEARAVRAGRPPGAVVHQALVAVPPFYRATWFRALCLLGLLATAVLGYRLRVRRLHAHARTLRRVVAERTRDLMSEKQKTEEQARSLVELDAAKSRFFANISHEFRTPLTLLTGPLEDALAGAYDPQTLRRQHRLMLRQARRLLHLVNRLLDLSKLEAGKMTLQRQPGDFVAFLRMHVRGFAPLAERRRIALRFRSDVEARPSRFDPDALATVFGNLLSNALKFTPEGGKVWVTVSTWSVERGQSDQGASNEPSIHTDPQDGVEVVVKDTGPGIPRSDLSRIFNRFEQVDGSTTRPHAGTGIGLALARELVDLHGGKLLVESEAGFGSVFIVRLPLEGPGQDETTEPPGGNVREWRPSQGLMDMPGRPTEAGPGPTAVTTGGPTILIVEDNPDVRTFLRSHLEPHYRVIEAADGEAGLKQAHAHRPDLILSDVMMPRMDGHALCRALKADEALCAIPIILLTARSAEKDPVDGFEAGADDYLTKPFSTDELRARIAHLIAVRRRLREQFSREVRVEPAGIAIPSEEAAFLERVLAVVEARLGDSTFTVEALAAEVGLSSRQLTRRVRAVTGESPGGLIRRLRVERATHLLEAGAGNVAEVAYAVGFRDVDHFSRRFRQAYGVPPSQYGTDRT